MICHKCGQPLEDQGVDDGYGERIHVCCQSYPHYTEEKSMGKPWSEHTPGERAKMVDGVLKQLRELMIDPRSDISLSVNTPVEVHEGIPQGIPRHTGEKTIKLRVKGRWDPEKRTKRGKKSKKAKETPSRRPIQPIEVDKNGDLRFVENKIVNKLLELVGEGVLNEMATWDVSDEDRMQFAMLIGYSLGGFAELCYTSDEVYSAARAMAEDGMSEEEGRLNYYEDLFKQLREQLKEPMGALFGKHPDDFTDRW